MRGLFDNILFWLGIIIVIGLFIDPMTTLSLVLFVVVVGFIFLVCVGIFIAFFGGSKKGR